MIFGILFANDISQVPTTMAVGSVYGYLKRPMKVL